MLSEQHLNASRLLSGVLLLMSAHRHVTREHRVPAPVYADLLLGCSRTGLDRTGPQNVLLSETSTFPIIALDIISKYKMMIIIIHFKYDSHKIIITIYYIEMNIINSAAANQDAAIS